MRAVIFIISLFFSQSSFGQKTKVIYLDENGYITKEMFADCYREVTQNSQGNYNVEGFYLSGKRQMTGQYRTKKLVGEIGSFKYYDEQGNLETVEFYEDGKLEGNRTQFFANGKTKISERYTNGELHGDYRSFYEDSTLCAEATFVHGNIRGIARRYSIEGKLIFEMNVDASGNGNMRSFYLNGDIREEGSFEEDHRIGNWNSYNRGNALAKTEKYFKTSNTGSSSKNYNTHLRPESSFLNAHNFEIIEMVGVVLYPDQEAEFKGGPVALQNYIVRNIAYPEEAIEKDVQGKAYLYFVVEIDGSISNVKVLKSPRLLKKESIRVIEEMPNWKPGELKKEKVRTLCRMPIVYTLN